MLNSKSFREIKNVAPYGKPKTRITNNGKRKVSIFNKVKSLINKSFDSLKSGDDNEQNNNNNNKLNNTPMVPGGFFEEGNRSINHSKTHDSIIASSQINAIQDEEEEDDISMANISNAKLANFFRQKGDAPLTDIEMEGVMSLMRKSSMPQLPSHNNQNHNMANSTFTTLHPTDENISMNNFNTSSSNNKVFKSSRILSTSSNANTTTNNLTNGFKVPQFMPKYDTTNDSIGSRVSSAASTRRVFDYSGMKSPYRKTVIFKYPSHRRSVSTPHPQVTKHVSKAPQTTKKGTNGQRMTNVASALVTLLENNNSSTNNSTNDNEPKDNSITITKESKSLANPYSTIIRKPQQRQQVINLEKNNEPELVVQNPVIPVVGVPIVSAANTTITNTYKPARSSSLCSNVVVADDEQTKEPKKKDVEEKKDVETKPVVPQTSSFTFSFNNKDKTSEEKKHKEPENKPTTPFSFTSKKPTAAPVVNASVPVTKAPFFSIPIPKRKNDNEDNIEKVGKKEESAVSDSKNITKKYNYEFESPSKSGIDATEIDESKVNQFKSMFVF